MGVAPVKVGGTKEHEQRIEVLRHAYLNYNFLFSLSFPFYFVFFCFHRVFFTSFYSYLYQLILLASQIVHVIEVRLGLKKKKFASETTKSKPNTVTSGSYLLWMMR